MQFSELPLYAAIYEVRQAMVASGESPGEEAWYVDEDRRTEFCKRVFAAMNPNCNQAIMDAAIRFRKGAKAEGTDMRKLELVMEVAKRHGQTCFYANRGLGECSIDVHLDRILPGNRGGTYSVENCVIACSRHNTMRGDMSIEEFLLSSFNSTP